MMETQPMESVAAMGVLGFVPFAIFGCLYIALIIAFVWGFFSMVSSQKRIAAAQEDTARVLREIAGSVAGRSISGG